MIVSTIRYEDRSEPHSPPRRQAGPGRAGTSRSAVRTRRSPDGERAGVTRTRERRAFANELARTPATEPGRPGGHTRPSRRSPDARSRDRDSDCCRDTRGVRVLASADGGLDGPRRPASPGHAIHYFRAVRGVAERGRLPRQRHDNPFRIRTLPVVRIGAGRLAAYLCSVPRRTRDETVFGISFGTKVYVLRSHFAVVSPSS